MLISPAYAQAASGGEQSLLGFLPLLLMFVVLYFIMIRPQMKRAKEHRQLVEALSKGDEVVMASGLVGRVEEVDATYLRVAVTLDDKPVVVSVQRQAVQTLLPKGSLKEIFKG